MHCRLHLGLFGRRTFQLNAKGRRGSPPSFSQPSYRLISTRRPSGTNSRSSRNPWLATSAGILVIAGGSYVSYENYQPFRHSVLAAVRCWRVAVAAVLGAIDYKATFAKAYESEDIRLQAYSECHTRSAKRVLKALLANGGIFIKLGQHMSSLFVLPSEWTRTMRPLQDQCEPTPYEHVEALFVSDMGLPISELFEEFDPEPIGVASLAQVHVARLRDSGKQVAVKLQHPHLAEFCDIDMEMVEVTLGWIKHWFPDFEFTWLAEEMRTNLPKEMDFTHEANNAARTTREFHNITTSLYIPSVLTSTKRVLIMEYIKGGRVDDLVYLADSNIDRNKVALELSRIFNQMVFINGWFHADPHPGNLLIRPAPVGSRSPYNFEIVLLDHGLYFDLDTDLRVNYSKFWLSLIAPASPSTSADRRKYAELVGNIGPDLYPVFEAAITGRAALEGTWEDDVGSSSEAESPPSTFKRASGMIDMMPQTEEEMEAIRNAVINREGLLVSVFDVLRRVPRRVLMVLKLNDLTRHLDHALMTTHSNIRIFLITAKYCTFAVWQNDRRRLIDLMRDQGLISFNLLSEYFTGWWRFKKNYYGIVFVETIMDAQARLALLRAWTQGLWSRGFKGAHEAAAGLA
ncbi:Mitochondrial structure and function regulator [Pleurotus pulmonarius]